MEVRDWLKRASDNGKKPSRQMRLVGERFETGMRLVGFRERSAVFFVARLPRIIILRGMVNHPELEGWAMLWRSIAIRQ